MGTHIPIRECILCRRKFEKKKLLRITKSADGILTDKTQKKEGRGAYICPECRKDENLLKKRVLDRAFRQRVGEEVYKELMSDKE